MHPSSRFAASDLNGNSPSFGFIGLNCSCRRIPCFPDRKLSISNVWQDLQTCSVGCSFHAKSFVLDSVRWHALQFTPARACADASQSSCACLLSAVAVGVSLFAMVNGRSGKRLDG